MALDLDPAELRAVVERAIDAAREAGPGELDGPRRYLDVLTEHRLATPRWPEHCGGRDLSGPDAEALDAVLADLQPSLPDLYPFLVGTIIVGPTLIAAGTREQQDRWCTPISTGAEIWCQMFSEPNAGSDMANVHTIATRDDTRGGWTLQGQKVWTSRAHYADWGFCLARTDPDRPKHKGLTMFALDMRDPGVEVRPLVQMNRDLHFNEVFLDAAFVPDDQVIGEVDQGWKVAMTALGFERAGAAMRRPDPGPLRAPAWIRELIDKGAVTTPEGRAAVVEAFVQAAVADLTERRALAAAQGGVPSPAGSGAKLRAVRAFRAMAAARQAVLGPYALLLDEPGTHDILTAPSMSIRGGTDEIQRNILAERVLGLPAEPKPDADVSWRDGRR